VRRLKITEQRERHAMCLQY